MITASIGLLLLPLVAPPMHGSEVALDWSALDASLVERCELEEIDDHLFQSLLAQGYAIVEVADRESIEIRIGGTSDTIWLEVRGSAILRSQEVEVPADCDSGLALDVSHRVLAELKVLEGLLQDQRRSVVTPEAATDSTDAQPAPTPTLESVPPTETGLLVAIDLVGGVAWPGEPNPLGTFRLAVVFPVWVLELGGYAEIALGGKSGLFVIQNALGVSLGVELPIGRMRMGFQGSGSVVRHGFSIGERSGYHIDGRVELAARLMHVDLPLFVQLGGYGRFRPVDHRINATDKFNMGAWGALLAMGWRISWEREQGVSR